MSDQHSRRGDLLERIAELLPLAAPPPNWAFLPSYSGVRRVDQMPAAMIATLTQEYSAVDLEAARVLKLVEGNDPELSPVLAEPGAPVLVLRQQQQVRPYDLISHQGSLVSSDPPAFHACRDINTRQLSGQTRRILVACSPDDMTILSLLQLPCTVASGLDHMTGRNVRRLFNIMTEDGDGPLPVGQLASVCRDEYMLVLVAWNVHDLTVDPPAIAKAVVARIGQASQAFGGNVCLAERIKLWQPREMELARVRAAVELRDVKQVRHLLWQSFQLSTKSLSTMYPGVVSAAPNYFHARRQLEALRGQEHSVGRDQMQSHVDALRRGFDRDVVEAIHQDALATDNLLERSLLVGAADLMRAWHDRSDLVDHFQHVASGGLVAQDDPEKRHQDQLQIVEQLVRMHRALYRQR